MGIPSAGADDDETVSSGLAAGARGYVPKSDANISLEAAISALSLNRSYFSSSISEVLLNSPTYERRRSRLECFTPREFEVAQQIVEGRCNEEIARQLKISLKTVESHRSAGMRKAGVRTADQLVRFAIKHKLIEA